MDASYQDFLRKVGSATVCGAVIGLERQWRQRAAGLRTYTLVALGSSLFISVVTLLTGPNIPSQMASNVASGVGFLGAGAMLRNGLTVRGINTAAAIWCSAAVGILAGYGFLLEAFTGTGFILLVNIVLRPVTYLITPHPDDPAELDVHYCLRVSCRGRNEPHVRTLLVQLLMGSGLILREIESVKGEDANCSELRATLSGPERVDNQMEQIATRLSLEPAAVKIAWQLMTTPRE